MKTSKAVARSPHKVSYMAEAKQTTSQSSAELQKLREELLRMIVKNNNSNDSRVRRVAVPR